jgi:hypothetical protein
MFLDFLKILNVFTFVLIQEYLVKRQQKTKLTENQYLLALNQFKKHGYLLLKKPMLNFMAVMET